MKQIVKFYYFIFIIRALNLYAGIDVIIKSGQSKMYPLVMRKTWKNADRINLWQKIIQLQIILKLDKMIQTLKAGTLGANIFYQLTIIQNICGRNIFY